MRTSKKSNPDSSRHEDATSTIRKLMDALLLGRRCVDTSCPGRRLARLQLAVLSLGYTNGCAFGPKTTHQVRGKYRNWSQIAQVLGDTNRQRLGVTIT